MSSSQPDHLSTLLGVWRNVADETNRVLGEETAGFFIYLYNDALDILKYMPHRGARMIEQVLKSAMANAEDKGIRNVGDLIVVDARGDGGPMFKRLMPRARGMAYMIRRRSAHISIGLSDLETLRADEQKLSRSASD